MRLIDWGEAHKIKYYPNLAPAEYTALIENQFKIIEMRDYMKNHSWLEEEATQKQIKQIKKHKNLLIKIMQKKSYKGINNFKIKKKYSIIKRR